MSTIHPVILGNFCFIHGDTTLLPNTQCETVSNLPGFMERFAFSPIVFFSIRIKGYVDGYLHSQKYIHCCSLKILL